MKKNKKLLEALKDARENGVVHFAFVGIKEGHVISMNCTSEDMYDCFLSLCLQKDDFLDLLSTVIEDANAINDEPDEEDVLPN